MRMLFSSIGLVALTSVAMAGNITGKGPNGGRIADAATLHVELVTNGSEIAVFTYDHDNKPVPAAGMVARVTVQDQGKTRMTDLAVAQKPNELRGTLESTPGKGARIIVSLTPKGGKPQQARFTAD